MSKRNIDELRSDLRERRERMELHRNAIIDIVSAYVPLLAPLVPALLTLAAIAEHYPVLLHIPTAAAVGIGIVAAAAVESLGVLSIETALAMWQWNQTAAADDRAPLWLAVTATAVYMVTVVGLVVLLKIFPALAVWSLLPLTALGAIASVIAVSRKQHSEREYARSRQVKPAIVAGDVLPVADELSTVAVATPKKSPATTNRKLPAAERRFQLLALLNDVEVPDDINKSALAEALDCSRSTVSADMAALVKAGRLSLNGVVEVL